MAEEISFNFKKGFCGPDRKASSFSKVKIAEVGDSVHVCPVYERVQVTESGKDLE